MNQLVESLRFASKPSNERAVLLKSYCDKVMAGWEKVENSDLGTARSLTPNKYVQRGLPYARQDRVRKNLTLWKIIALQV